MEYLVYNTDGATVEEINSVILDKVFNCLWNKKSECIRIGELHWDVALSIYELSEQERSALPFWSVAALALDPDNHLVVFIKNKLAQFVFLKEFLPLAKHIMSINALEELFERDKHGDHYLDRLIEAVSQIGI